MEQHTTLHAFVRQFARNAVVAVGADLSMKSRVSQASETEDQRATEGCLRSLFERMIVRSLGALGNCWLKGRKPTELSDALKRVASPQSVKAAKLTGQDQLLLLTKAY